MYLDTSYAIGHPLLHMHGMQAYRLQPNENDDVVHC